MRKLKIFVALMLCGCLISTAIAAVSADGLSELAIEAVIISTEEMLRRPSRDGLRVCGKQPRINWLQRICTAVVQVRIRSPDWMKRRSLEIGLVCFNARDQGSFPAVC